MLARWGEVGKCSRDGKAVRVFDAYNPTIDDCSIEISKIVLRIGCFSRNETNRPDLCSVLPQKKLTPKFFGVSQCIFL